MHARDAHKRCAVIVVASSLTRPGGGHVFLLEQGKAREIGSHNVLERSDGALLNGAIETRALPFEFEAPNGRRYAVAAPKVQRGHCHPRIWRPPITGSRGRPPPSNAYVLGSAAAQYHHLCQSLVSIFGTISPEEPNMSAFGNALRNVILLACTEFEAQCRGVLAANGYVLSDRSGTADYVKLSELLFLPAYALSLPAAPWLPDRRPFEGWDSTRPTQSLPWYDAYNSIKHDRERNFAKASLQHAIDSVAACAVMLHAQFGFLMDTPKPPADLFALVMPNHVFPFPEGHYVYAALDHSDDGTWTEIPAF